MRVLKEALSELPEVIKAGVTNWLVQVQTLSAENALGIAREIPGPSKTSKPFFFTKSQTTDISVFPEIFHSFSC